MSIPGFSRRPILEPGECLPAIKMRVPYPLTSLMLRPASFAPGSPPFFALSHAEQVTPPTAASIVANGVNGKTAAEPEPEPEAEAEPAAEETGAATEESPEVEAKEDGEDKVGDPVGLSSLWSVRPFLEDKVRVLQ